MTCAILATILLFIDQNWVAALWAIVALLSMVECYLMENRYYKQEEYLYKLTEEYFNTIIKHGKEVKKLKEEIESLQEQYKTCFDGFEKRGTKLGELMMENVKLRNKTRLQEVLEWLDKTTVDDTDCCGHPVISFTCFDSKEQMLQSFKKQFNIE